MLHASRAADPSSPPAWGGKLEALGASLRFPRVPGAKREEYFNSPADLTRDKLRLIRDNFIELRTATEPRGGN